MAVLFLLRGHSGLLLNAKVQFWKYWIASFDLIVSFLFTLTRNCLLARLCFFTPSFLELSTGKLFAYNYVYIFNLYMYLSGCYISIYPFIYLFVFICISLSFSQPRCENNIDSVCKAIEKTINQTIQNTLNTLEKDCFAITSKINDIIDADKYVFFFLLPSHAII